MLLRGVLGFPLSIAIGYVITILISIGLGQGYHHPCTPELIEYIGSKLNAVIVQAVLCGLLGVAFGASSATWEIGNWSIFATIFIFMRLIQYSINRYTARKMNSKLK